MDVSLADSGFVIKRYDGLEAFEGTSEDDENQPDRYLSGNGSASLAMSWSAMGVDTEEAKSDTYELQGVFNFHNALDSEKALFTTRATKLLAEPDGSLKIMLADGSEYTSTTSPLVKDGKNTIQYHFGMDSVVLSPKKINYKDGSYTVDANTGATVDGKEISSYGKKQLTDYRRYDIGFVFQFYNLVGNLTALENVELASQICSDPLDAGQVLADVGLADRASNFPAQLSGGEQQRVAIARALAKNPKLLLCDEPTGALDYNTGKAVLKLLQDTCRKKGVTVVVITHNQAITAMADRIITVKNGTVTDMRKNEHIVPVEQIEW